jgi:hypothetical protein
MDRQRIYVSIFGTRYQGKVGHNFRKKPGGGALGPNFDVCGEGRATFLWDSEVGAVWKSSSGDFAASAASAKCFETNEPPLLLIAFVDGKILRAAADLAWILPVVATTIEDASNTTMPSNSREKHFMVTAIVCRN